MADYSMPETIASEIDKIFGQFPEVMFIDRDIDDAIVVLIKVANHPDADCDYVSKLNFTWDVPGQLLCYASIGVWNPPAPKDGYITSSLIDLSPHDQDAMHEVLKRAVAVPFKVARKGFDMITLMMSMTIDSLKKNNTPFSESHFSDGDNPDELAENAFYGLVATDQNQLIQWAELVESVRSE